MGFYIQFQCTGRTLYLHISGAEYATVEYFIFGHGRVHTLQVISIDIQVYIEFFQLSAGKGPVDQCRIPQWIGYPEILKIDIVVIDPYMVAEMEGGLQEIDCGLSFCEFHLSVDLRFVQSSVHVQVDLGQSVQIACNTFCIGINRLQIEGFQMNIEIKTLAGRMIIPFCFDHPFTPLLRNHPDAK